MQVALAHVRANDAAQWCQLFQVTGQLVVEVLLQRSIKGLRHVIRVCTLPLQQQKVPGSAVTGIFYGHGTYRQGFRWQRHLRQGGIQRLLSTGSGLLRYRLKDLVRVDGLPGGIPALTFLGRAGTTDLVGEKVTAAALDDSLSQVTLPPKTLPVCTVAVEDTP